MTGFVEVRATVSVEHYKLLARIAKEHDTTVGALVGELTKRSLTHAKKGRPTKYTRDLAERIHESRWMHRTWEQIGVEVGVSPETAKKYHARYEAETSNTNPEGCRV
jgi:Mn-dependent DtxR family transcriptional regulator